MSQVLKVNHVHMISLMLTVPLVFMNQFTQREKWDLPDPKGDKSSLGPPGKDGHNSLNGLIGLQSPPGQKGRIGLLGIEGVMGSINLTGEIGSKGPKGRMRQAAPKG